MSQPFKAPMHGAVVCIHASQWLASGFWLLWKLSAMPHRNNPDDRVPYLIKEPVWWDNYFPVWKFRELRYNSSRFRKYFKPSQNGFRFVSKVYGR